MNPTPEWLTRRGGTLRQGWDGSWYVCLNGHPQYMLGLIPVAGKHGCQVVQTNNGKHLEGKGVFATAEEALQGGLEDLRQALGW